MTEFEATNRYCFTTWEKPKFNKFNLCEFMIYQSERAEGGKEHFQGYIEFKKNYKLNQVKSLFKTTNMNVSSARENRERNILYCSKTRTYTGLRITYSEEKLVEQNDSSIEDWADFEAMFDLPVSRNIK